jgi:hypothetical protein
MTIQGRDEHRRLRRRRALRAWTGGLGAALLWAVAAVAVQAADAVKIGGFWLEGVTVQGVVEGQLVYVSAAGVEAAKPMTQVQGVRLERHPQLQAAAAALEAGKPSDAQRELTALRQGAREPWVKLYAGALLLPVLDQRGEAVKAVELWIELATAKDTLPQYAAQPPIAAVEKADGNAKAAAERLLASATTLPKEGPVAQAAARLRQAIQTAAPSAPAVPTAGTGTPTTKPVAPTAPVTPTTLTKPAAPATAPTGATTSGGAATSGGGAGGGGLLDPSQWAVVLPTVLVDDKEALEVNLLLQKGEFGQALELVNKQLTGTGGLARKLYQQGMATLGLADAAAAAGDVAKADALYKDAGLSLMQVLAYFPRSTYGGPALVETGYVHSKIGRPDLAASLYNRAVNLIDDQEDPRYAARLQALLAKLDAQAPAPQ